MSEFITVAKVGEIPEGRGRGFPVEDIRIGVFLSQGQYYALDDSCPHMGAPLSLGDVCDGHVVCDRHLWSFSLSDGSCPDVPHLKAQTFKIRIQGDEIQVCLPEDY